MSESAPQPGIVVVDKPGGMTSHDVVGRCRRLFGTRKVGHAGTLDPMATGVLVLGVNRATRLITIFGGKLTDCINVGDEICEYVQQMDITLPAPREKWYGEPSADIRAVFFRQAERIGLDRLTPPSSTEPLSTRYWRRYGAEAITLLKQIQADPRQAELLIQGTEYTRCELQLAAQREMITKLEDFLRRRSKIALVVRKADIKHSQGLMEACEILFGDQAQQKFDEYFADSGSVEDGIDRADMSHSKALNW